MWDLLTTAAIFVTMGIVSYALGYLIYRKVSVAFWAYISVFLPSIPVFVLSVLGASNLVLVSWLSHTIGILIYPVIMAIIDILLIEISLLRFVKPFRFLLPGAFRTAIKIEETIETLEEYHAIPRPIRVQRVYIVGIIAGLVNLIFSLAFNLI